MKNITIILLIIILPIAAFIFLDRNRATSDIALADNNQPTFMLFTSTMCLDCKRVKSELALIEDDYKDRVNIVKINALEKKGDTKKMVKKYEVTLVPTLIFIDKDNKIINKTEGYMSKEDMIKLLESMLNG
ncbi:thioredoxin family protein [bacterium]|nr:thioredoxin family protein [bacterium]